MNKNLQKAKWCENVILIDADYVDRLAYLVITNFEQILKRPLPSVDFAQWIEYVALDGGVNPIFPEENNNTTQQTQVILIRGKKKNRMENFVPSNIKADLNGKAFNGNLGEFLISAYPVENIAGGENLLTEILELLTTQEEVKRIMVIANVKNDRIYNNVREALRNVDAKDKRVTVFVMSRMPANQLRKENFREDILGFSVLSALGVKAEEVEIMMYEDENNNQYYS